jgi:hypothetical protein
MSDDARDGAGRPGGAEPPTGPGPADEAAGVTGGAGQSGPVPPGDAQPGGGYPPGQHPMQHGAGPGVPPEPGYAPPPAPGYDTPPGPGYGAPPGPGYGAQPPPGYGAPYGTPPGLQERPPKKKMGCLPKAAIALGVVVVIAVVATIAGGSDDDDGDTATGTTQAATTAPPAAADPAATTPADPTATTTAEPAEDSGGGQDVYAVGETATSSDLGVTLVTVQDPYESGNEFDVPQPGNRFVAAEVELTNDSDEPITWSSIMGAELTDSQNRPWTVALAGLDLPQLDGDVPAGGARRGWMVFEVPQDATGLQLRIKGSLTAAGSLFDLS